MYTIQTAMFSKEKEVGGNPMHIYTIGVVDGNGQLTNCELLQRPTSPAPAPGQQIEGEIKPSSNPAHLPTFKRAQQNRGGGGGGRGFSAKDVARITRSHSQEMALRFMELTGGATIDWTNGDADHLKAEVSRHFGNIKKLADMFDNDVTAAGASVAGGGGQQPAQQAQQTPPPQQQQAAQPPAQQQPPQQQPPAQPAAQPDPDDDIPF